jgi:hypothetical protein
MIASVSSVIAERIFLIPLNHKG